MDYFTHHAPTRRMPQGTQGPRAPIHAGPGMRSLIFHALRSAAGRPAGRAGHDGRLEAHRPHPKVEAGVDQQSGSGVRTAIGITGSRRGQIAPVPHAAPARARCTLDGRVRSVPHGLRGLPATARPEGRSSLSPRRASPRLWWPGAHPAPPRGALQPQAATAREEPPRGAPSRPSRPMRAGFRPTGALASGVRLSWRGSARGGGEGELRLAEPHRRFWLWPSSPPRNAASGPPRPRRPRRFPSSPRPRPSRAP